ncbi:MAG: exodeoxyribonuclease VII large subunit [Acidobacteriota bacterium]
MKLSFSEPARKIFTITEINHVSRMLLEDSLTDIWLEGEISNVRQPGSGHLYFSLKDSQAEISAVMFRSQNAMLKFKPENGLQVLVNGRVSLYEARGIYQVNVQCMEPHGQGALHLAFEQLKQKLSAEGLFEAERKRPIPAVPRRVGVVTSPTGAALRDILRVLKRRHAGVNVLLAPARVQGEGAAREIALAIQALNELDDIDVMIVGRGGGSIEDLWPFNEERVARAIVGSRIPVICAVGHEIDVTISDWVADVRASTPSAAAEMVVASRTEMLERINGLCHRLLQAFRLRAAAARNRLDRLLAASDPKRLADRLQRSAQRVDDLQQRASLALRRCVDAARARWSRAFGLLQPSLRRERLHRQVAAVGEVDRRLRITGRWSLERSRTRHSEARRALESLSPLSVLGRGYALCLDPRTGSLVLAWDQVTAGDPVQVRLSAGGIDCEVQATHPPQHKRC